MTEDEQRAKGFDEQRQESLLGRKFDVRLVVPPSCHVTPSCTLSRETFAFFFPGTIIDRTYDWKSAGDGLVAIVEKTVEDECIEGEDTVVGLFPVDITETVTLSGLEQRPDGTGIWRQMLIDYVEDAREGGNTGCEDIRYRAEGVLTLQ